MSGFPGIDAGHGGDDLGTTAGRTPEAVYTLEMAEEVSNLGVVGSYLIRCMAGDDPTNKERGEIARDARCPFVVALHVNAGSPSYHGAHAFYREGNALERAIATAIMQAWPSCLSRKYFHPVERNGIYIAGAVEPVDGGRWPRVESVYNGYGDMPLVLVEMYYASNPEDDAHAHNDLVRDEMALAIARGIIVGKRILRGDSC